MRFQSGISLSICFHLLALLYEEYGEDSFQSGISLSICFHAPRRPAWQAGPPPVSIRHQPEYLFSRGGVQLLDTSGALLFQSGISLSICFHRASPSPSRSGEGRAFQSGISLSICFHLSGYGYGYPNRGEYVSIRHQPEYLFSQPPTLAESLQLLAD